MSRLLEPLRAFEAVRGELPPRRELGRASADFSTRCALRGRLQRTVVGGDAGERRLPSLRPTPVPRSEGPGAPGTRLPGPQSEHRSGLFIDRIIANVLIEVGLEMESYM